MVGNFHKEGATIWPVGEDSDALAGVVSKPQTLVGLSGWLGTLCFRFAPSILARSQKMARIKKIDCMSKLSRDF